MLNITDLLFGDYFQNSNGNIFRMTYAVFNRYINDDSFETIFSPVPLSDKILEHNFPTTDYLVWFPIGNTGCYQIEINDELKSMNVVIPIKYVHELQHLLKICNIDKDIKLRY